MDYVIIGAWGIGGFAVLVVGLVWLGKIVFGYFLPSVVRRGRDAL